VDIALWLELIAFIILMAFSGFFSSSETALFSLNAVQIEQMRRDEDPNVSLIKRMLAEPRRLIVTILIGNEFVNVAASVISAAIVISLFGAENKYLNLFIMVPILLLVGEITPKTLALRNNVAFASFQSRPIQLFAKSITPLRWIIRVIADWITTLIIGKERTRGSIVTQDMMRTLAHEAEEEGVLTQHEARFIDHIFDFGDQTVADIMTPRAAIFYLSVDLPLTEIVAELNRTRHARVPIYKDNRDNVIGILYARDLLKIDLQAAINEGKPISEFLREPFLVPEVKPAEEMFETFRERNLSVAMTVDEFGGITGLITMTDLLEHIFGSIRSLSDAARMHGVLELEKGRYSVEGDMTVSEFNREMNTKLVSDNAHTIAGLILNNYGELPPKDSVVEIDGIRFLVAEVDRYRITKLTFEVREPSAADETAESGDTGSPTAEPVAQSTQIGDLPAATASASASAGESKIKGE
jgi:CBS domain containing-hemolysin-like protein